MNVRNPPLCRIRDDAPDLVSIERNTQVVPSPVSVVSWNCMPFPIKVCVVCKEEFELKPDKPGFANRCPVCSDPENEDSGTKQSMDADERKSIAEANEARRKAMRDLLYRKDS
jgi:hypothetical protein